MAVTVTYGQLQYRVTGEPQARRFCVCVVTCGYRTMLGNVRELGKACDPYWMMFFNHFARASRQRRGVTLNDAY